MSFQLPIEEDIRLDESGFRRKRFTYDRRVHHSYIFIAGGKLYTVVFGSLKELQKFTDIGYTMPLNIPFPQNGMSEVYFDLWTDRESFGDFRHVKFKGLAGGVVLEQVALAMLQHYQTFTIGGFVFQAAGGAIADFGRSISLEETYDYIPGLKDEQRYNKKNRFTKRETQKATARLLESFQKRFDREGLLCRYAVKPCTCKQKMTRNDCCKDLLRPSLLMFCLLLVFKGQAMSSVMTFRIGRKNPLPRCYAES
ncbi:hypothetical protein [Serratia proteamaculans]|uniref:hypothetical protein n=1 Tax=Serratia proteamaculans TaxID=28151 RepID=UPI001F10F071|nr:hypothetical protein [Serratia proteamaculans]